MEFEIIKNNIINITTSQFPLFIKHQVPISSIPVIFKIKHYCIPRTDLKDNYPHHKWKFYAKQLLKIITRGQNESTCKL